MSVDHGHLQHREFRAPGRQEGAAAHLPQRRVCAARRGPHHDRAAHGWVHRNQRLARRERSTARVDQLHGAAVALQGVHKVHVGKLGELLRLEVHGPRRPLHARGVDQQPGQAHHRARGIPGAARVGAPALQRRERDAQPKPLAQQHHPGAAGEVHPDHPGEGQSPPADDRAPHGALQRRAPGLVRLHRNLREGHQRSSWSPRPLHHALHARQLHRPGECGAL
mmetsp:Transcript_75974/g.181770  ORF Transcript_75974/g.181770 Transcript_75974/m.181770 type:complete len:223 (+) Transcript_75974:860-1528(+)